MQNRVKNASILITGANGGIGIETVKMLVDEQAKRVALACRTIEKAEQAKSMIGNSATVLEPYGGFDMTDETGIGNAVSKLPAGQKFDIIFLQSGGMVVSPDFKFIEKNDQRFERNIYQNVIGGYITLRELAKHDLIAEGARIVFAGGEGARGVKGLIDKPDFKFAKDITNYITDGKGAYKDINALAVSKFMSGLLVQKLAQIDKHHEYVWFSPGLTGGTKGLKDVPQPKRFVMEKIGFPMMQLLGIAQGPRKAAAKYVEGLKGTYGNSGDLIGAPEGKAIGALVDQKPMNEGLTNHNFREVFWNVVTENFGLINLN